VSSRRATTAVLCVVQFMVILDSTVTTVALDSVRLDLGADERTLQYVLSAGPDPGLASGLLNTAQQVGLAVGVAALVGTAPSDGPPAALVAGYNAGLRGGAVVAAIGAVLTAAASFSRAVPARGRGMR
jgi:MFS family permease